MSTFKENPYTPLPFEMRTNRTYCEIPINATTARFMEIYYVSYDEQKIAKWKQQDVLEEAMGKYLQRVEGQPLDKDVYFIYLSLDISFSGRFKTTNRLC